MSTDAITMQDLELEHAELLPSRETLNACCRSPHSNSYSVTNGSNNGNGDGNGNWAAHRCSPATATATSTAARSCSTFPAQAAGLCIA